MSPHVGCEGFGGLVVHEGLTCRPPHVADILGLPQVEDVELHHDGVGPEVRSIFSLKVARVRAPPLTLHPRYALDGMYGAGHESPASTQEF